MPDGFTGFTPCQNEILARMMSLAKKVMVTVTIDPREVLHDKQSEHRLFGLSHKTIDKLCEIAEKTNTKVEEPIYVQGRNGYKVPYRFRSSPALAFLEKICSAILTRYIVQSRMKSVFMELRTRKRR